MRPFCENATCSSTGSDSRLFVNVTLRVVVVLAASDAKTYVPLLLSLSFHVVESPAFGTCVITTICIFVVTVRDRVCDNITSSVYVK